MVLNCLWKTDVMPVSSLRLNHLDMANKRYGRYPAACVRSNILLTATGLPLAGWAKSAMRSSLIFNKSWTRNRGVTTSFCTPSSLGVAPAEIDPPLSTLALLPTLDAFAFRRVLVLGFVRWRNAERADSALTFGSSL